MSGRELPPVPLADPRSDLAAQRETVLAAVTQAIDSGSYILGPQVGAFERALATQLGVAGSVGVGSGTDALVLAILALGIGIGDEIITVSHTAGPTVAAINMTGATPVLIDIEPDSYCLDPGRLEVALTERTRAILPVHLYGHPAAVEAIIAFAEAHDIFVIEDCAQAQGSTIGGREVGSFGHTSCFSFYPTKNLGALGDGGLVCAQSTDTLERLRQLRTYGWTRPQFAELANGRCSRLDELQAAILNVRLPYLARNIEARRNRAHRYNEAFSGLPLGLPLERNDCRHAFHLYVVRSKLRDALAAHLAARNVVTGRHYPYPVHRQTGLAARARIPAPLLETETATNEILSLPLFATLSDDQQMRVVDAVRSFFGAA